MSRFTAHGKYRNYKNEAPLSPAQAGRGVCAELRHSLTRLRSIELRPGSPCLSSLKQALGNSGEGEKNFVLSTFRGFGIIKNIALTKRM